MGSIEGRKEGGEGGEGRKVVVGRKDELSNTKNKFNMAHDLSHDQGTWIFEYKSPKLWIGRFWSRFCMDFYNLKVQVYVFKVEEFESRFR
jgi:hypothetical protein